MADSKLTIAEIVRKIRESQGVQAGNGCRTQYSLSEKKRIVEIYKEGTDVLASIAWHLKKHKLGGGWEGMLKTWVADYDAGMYKIENAIAIGRVQPVKQDQSFESFIHSMMAGGLSPDSIKAQVELAIKSYEKGREIQELRDLLASKGLTLDDLR